MKKINYEKDKRALREFTAAELSPCSAAVPAAVRWASRPPRGSKMLPQTAGETPALQEPRTGERMTGENDSR